VRQAICEGRAIIETEGADPLQLMESEEFAPLQEAVTNLQFEMSASPEMAAINNDWLYCMADTGYPGLERQRDGFGRIMNLNIDLRANLWERGIDPDTATESRELQQKEIELALADLQCRETTDYWGRVNALRDTMENQFIEDNKAAFIALRDAMEQRGF